MYLDPNGIAVVEETDPIVPLQTLLNSMQSATSNVVSERIGTRISRQRFTGASAVPTTASGVTRNYAYAIKDTDDEGWSTVTFAAQFTLSWPSGNQNYNIASLSSAINPPFVVPAVGNAGNG